ncbi:MAG: topoisomerase DNA-binding C4 zinc finger domain-containing protein [Methanobrevibacter sp.]|jgi:DNA topoisomerase-1|nr:topoisomerase DNA-binding C4 zinc finger domain-containing protein [Candidatus Methanoflexus mossambicus]
MNELIICEKPSSAEKIAKALSSSAKKQKYGRKVNYWELEKDNKKITVASAVGHLYSLSPKNSREKYYFDLKWVPAYENEKGKGYIKEYQKAIAKFAKTSDKFVHACDYDREGTLIGYHAVLFSAGQKGIENTTRMKFSTLTKKDILTSYENQIPLDLNQADSGESRHVLDYYFGVNISKALSQSVKITKHRYINMSAGRVQTPTLSILVDREKEIQEFIPEPYWMLKAILKDLIKEDIVAEHVDGKITELKKAKAIFDKVTGGKVDFEDIKEKIDKKTKAKIKKGKSEVAGVVTKVKTTESTKKLPVPFDLSGLQSESYSVFGFSPKKTQTIAQSLYTNGYTSYPRTSSQKLPDSLELENILKELSASSIFRTHIEEVYNENNKKKFSKLKPNEGKKDDPAHPAIHPTGILPEKLTTDEEKIYKLIVNRFISVFSVDGKMETMRVDLNIADEKFFFRQKRISFMGWLAHYPYRKLEADEFPEIAKGDEIKVKEIISEEKETKPPARYNQSSLIKELEKRGLGTKATRADIISKLYDRDYIQGNKQIEVKKLGENIIDTLKDYANDLTNEELTRTLEKDLEKIMTGKIKKNNVIDKGEEEVKSILKDVEKNQQKIGEKLFYAYEESKIIGKCECEGNLMIKFSPKFKSYFVGCSDYPECNVTYSLPKGANVLKTTCDKCGLPMISYGKAKNRQQACLDPNCGKDKAELERKYNPKKVGKCPECGKDLLLRSGRYGEFIGCSGYPKCRFTAKSLEDLEKKLNPNEENNK